MSRTNSRASWSSLWHTDGFIVRWLAEGSVAALAGALREVAPELTRYPIVIPGGADAGADPRWVDDLAARFAALGLDP